MHEIEDATERVEVNSRFHTMIAHYSGNERVVEYLASFRERVNRDMYISSFNALAGLIFVGIIITEPGW